MQNILEIMPYVWGFVILLTIVIELSTSDIDAIWFTVGAALALILSLAKAQLLIQIGAFLGLTIVLIFTAGRWAKKFFLTQNIATNADSLIGRDVLVLEDVSENQKGSGMIGDIVWSLVCQKGEELPKGERAVIIAIDGNKLVVKKKV